MNRYFLIGETHGTKECPQEFFKFVIKNKIGKVALEFLKDNQKDIDKFYSRAIGVNEISFFKNKENTHDGRASDAVKNLISGLRKEKIRIFLVDEEAKSAYERDKLMAKNLSNIEGKVAFLCGEVHASKKPMQLEKSRSSGLLTKQDYFLEKIDSPS